MAQVQYVQTALNSGELSPQLDGRVDIAKYASGAGTMNNVLIRPYGGAYRRPGTYYVAAVKTATDNTRLIPFSFSTTQSYILEFGNAYIRVYKDGGQITSGGVALEITSPYDESDVFEIQYTQDADTMYLTHKDYPVQKLTRASHTSWTLSAVDFTDGPYLDFNTNTANILGISATVGVIQISSNASIFVPSHTGHLIKIDSTTSGYAKITVYNSATSVSASVVKTFASLGGSSSWQLGAWGISTGYPACCTFHEQRTWFAGSVFEPQDIWGSVIGEYENFDAGTTGDDDAVNYTIADNLVNSIRWLMSARALILGTSGGNFSADSDTSSGPITPSNIQIKRETTYGTALITPVRIGNYIYYTQRNSRTVREFAYNFDNDNYLAKDMNLLSEHITDGGIVNMAHMESPDPIIWCVKGNGDIACLTRQIDEDVYGWTRIKTQGSFCSVAVIPNGDEDQVWVVVKRYINGSWVKYVEYFMPFTLPDAQADSFFVDSGLTYDGTSAGTLSGLSHLESANVSILSNGSVHPDRQVSSAQISLNVATVKAHVGLSYTSWVGTLRLETGSSYGTSQAILGKTFKVWVRFWRSLGCSVGDENSMDTVSFRTSSMAMGTAPALYTGDKEVLPPTGWTRTRKVYVMQSQPLPMHIVALISRIEVTE